MLVENAAKRLPPTFGILKITSNFPASWCNLMLPSNDNSTNAKVFRHNCLVSHVHVITSTYMNTRTKVTTKDDRGPANTIASGSNGDDASGRYQSLKACPSLAMWSSNHNTRSGLNKASKLAISMAIWKPTLVESYRSYGSW